MLLIKGVKAGKVLNLTPVSACQFDCCWNSGWIIKTAPDSSIREHIGIWSLEEHKGDMIEKEWDGGLGDNKGRQRAKGGEKRL